MRRGLRLPILLASAALLSACGGDGGGSEPSATVDEYRSALDAACQEQYEALTGLPQTAQDEGLEVAEIEELAQEAGDRFVGDVESLQPPAELEQAHEALLDAFRAVREEPPSEGDLDAVEASAAMFADLYADLGASRCEALQQKAVESFEQAPAGPAG